MNSMNSKYTFLNAAKRNPTPPSGQNHCNDFLQELQCCSFHQEWSRTGTKPTKPSLPSGTSGNLVLLQQQREQARRARPTLLTEQICSSKPILYPTVQSFSQIYTEQRDKGRRAAFIFKRGFGHRSDLQKQFDIQNTILLVRNPKYRFSPECTHYSESTKGISDWACREQSPLWTGTAAWQNWKYYPDMN